MLSAGPRAPCAAVPRRDRMHPPGQEYVDELERALATGAGAPAPPSGARLGTTGPHFELELIVKASAAPPRHCVGARARRRAGRAVSGACVCRPQTSPMW
jgi:hypothetical protein